MYEALLELWYVNMYLFNYIHMFKNYLRGNVYAVLFRVQFGVIVLAVPGK